MSENPIMILLYVGVAVYVGRMYWADYRAWKTGDPHDVGPAAQGQRERSDHHGARAGP